MSIIQGNAHTSAGGGYQIERSLRFNSADSAYLNRTPGSAGNRDTWTYSAWIKRSVLSTNQTFFSARSDGSNYDYCSFNTSDQFSWAIVSGGSTVGRLITTQVFRDVSSWYHFLITYDSGNATGGNRMRFYVNGTEVTAFGTDTNPSQNQDGNINNTIAHNIGRFGDGTEYCNYYQTETYFIDGQAKTPSDFGETDTNTGVWKPKAYSGTYGTNGFYLNFSDNSGTTSTTLGKDYSGNGNNWTPNNFSVTAGAGNDSLVDTPTAYGTDTGVGGEVRGNYCTLNPLQTTQSASAPTNGNLTSPANAGVWRRIGATIQLPTTGKWYFEYNCDSFGTFATFSIGVFSGNIDTSNNAIGFSATEWGYNAQSGYASNNNTNISSGFTTATTGDVLQLAYDASTGSLWFGKNNTWQGASSPNPSTGTSPTYTGVYNVSPVMVQNWATQSVNFGQRAFAYTAPSGFKALCTQNLPTPTIGATSTTQANDYFDVSTWSGTGGSSRSITGINFQPDFVWGKVRNTTYGHMLFDAVRGAGSNKELGTNVTGAEGYGSSSQYGYLSAFNSNGFTVTAGTDGSIPNAYWNQSGNTYVGWQWKANGAGSSNTAGTITSTVSASTTSGFSIVTYTGTGSAATVGHGLGVTPSMVIVKERGSAGNPWITWHTSLAGGSYNVQLNTTAAQANATTVLTATPTSTVINVGTDSSVNGSTRTYVAYCFAAVAGYSAFGSFTGNGSADGPFVYTGFRPRYVLIKSSSNVEEWHVHDTARDTYNLAIADLYPNSSSAEVTNSNQLDILSNGFKCRSSNSGTNGSGYTFIYAAFAENPFKYSLAR